MIRSPAEISTIIPRVEVSTRIENRKLRRDESARYSAERMSVAADPISARILRKRAKSSTMKPSANVVSLPAGSSSSSPPASTRRQIARPVTRLVVCWPRKAPSIKSTMAPAASTSSGSTGSKGYPALSKLMARCPEELPSLQQAGCLHGCDCGGVVIDELLHRRRRHIQHQLRIDPKQDGESHQRHQRQALAEGNILDARQ